MIGETYLIGSGVECSNRDIVEMVLTAMGQPPDAYDRVPDRAGHDLRYATDSTKIRRELGWRPVYQDLTTGLLSTIDWYRDHEWWWKPAKESTEARYRDAGQ